MQLKRAVLCALFLAGHASAARPATSAKASAAGRNVTQAAAMAPASKETAAGNALPQLRSIISPALAHKAAAAGRAATKAAAVAPAKSAVNMSKDKAAVNALPQLRSIISPALAHKAAAAGRAATKTAAMAPAKSAANVSKETAAQNGLAELQSIMGRAQASLARVEKYHEKAVQKARATVGDLFQEQAKFMGVEVAKYASAVDQATRQLSSVINASKAELAAEEQAEAKNSSIGWGGIAMGERARAGAKVNAAFRELGHLERQKDRDVEEAMRHASAPLDDAAQTLSRRVGDLSSVSDEAKASLEWAARKSVAGASIMDKLSVPRSAKGVEKFLAATQNITAQKIKSADVAFAAALANATNVTEVGAGKIKQGLIEAEKEEMKRVRR